MTYTSRKALLQAPFRKEKDLLGLDDVPAQALFGIHTVRAIENFPVANRDVHPALIHAFGDVKGACAKTSRALGFWAKDEVKFNAIMTACKEMADGLLDSHVVVDALQGGAGTSTNMNVNEVLANRAIQILGGTLGDYIKVHPLDDINLHQSTNDAYPTALKLAIIVQIKALKASLSALIKAFRDKELAFSDVVKIGRTQLQDAVLTTLGREMGAYAEALSRDQGRLDRAIEAMLVVNLGGTAIGTGMAAPEAYIETVAKTLEGMTGYPFVRASNLIDNTQNADAFVEVSGLMKSCAATLIKIATDLRLMSSGPDGGLGEIALPARQAGSSIMPGKVNPVIPETVTQVALRVIGYDNQVTLAAAMGNLELNAFLPLVADSLLDGIDIMANAMMTFRVKCIEGITANKNRCHANVEGSTAILTALVPMIGYSQSVKILHDAQEQGKSVRDVVIDAGHMKVEEFDAMLSPESVNRLGSPLYINQD
ncbi:MAG: aspartate ammonia-lyase [Bdellovibrionales bacterium]|jgi:aspartate ammonia-lyase